MDALARDSRSDRFPLRRLPAAAVVVSVCLSVCLGTSVSIEWASIIFLPPDHLSTSSGLFRAGAVGSRVRQNWPPAIQERALMKVNVRGAAGRRRLNIRDWRRTVAEEEAEADDNDNDGAAAAAAAAATTTNPTSGSRAASTSETGGALQPSS